MEYYHGTDNSFNHFDLGLSVTFKDFGSGMYLAKDYDHAESVALGKNGLHAYVYVYDISIEKMRKSFRVLEFKKVSMNWVKFILTNRTIAMNSEYDIVIGPTADARAQDEIEKFYRRHKTRKPTIKEYKQLISKLHPYVYSTQIALLTQSAVDYVEDHYIRAITIK